MHLAQSSSEGLKTGVWQSLKCTSGLPCADSKFKGPRISQVVKVMYNVMNLKNEEGIAMLCHTLINPMCGKNQVIVSIKMPKWVFIKCYCKYNDQVIPVCNMSKLVKLLFLYPMRMLPLQKVIVTKWEDKLHLCLVFRYQSSVCTLQHVIVV